MPRSLAARLVLSVVTVFVVLTVTFAALHAAPGDPVRLYLGPSADEAAAETMRRAAGLDRPMPEQYARWLGGFLTGRWGESLAQRRPVTAVIASALAPTLVLVGTSLLATWLGGVLIGVIQAARRRRPIDTTLTVATTALQAVPAYVLALGLVLLFAYAGALWGWPAWMRLPAFGAESIGGDMLSPLGRLADRLRHLLLPALTLSLIGAAGAARYVRASMAEALRQPAVLTARAKGVSEGRVLLRHALRNALLPVITLAGLQLPALFSGSVFVETIFAWPGMGRVAVESVLGRDYPVAMAITAVFAILVVAGNLIADALAAIADPRLRSE